MNKKKNLYIIGDFSKNNILFDLNIGVNIAVMKCDKAFICLQRGWFWMSWKTEHFMVLTKMTTRQLLLAELVSAAGHNTKWDHFEICQQQQWKADPLLAVAFCILPLRILNF